jgi:tagatose 1,6-diphosphate aldolase
MEFPVDADFESDRAVWQRECERISESSAVPWVLLSAGVNFETFLEQTEVACRAGASGFLAGRAIWKESVALGDTERAEFLKATAADRLKRLIEVAERHARPWTDFYQPMTATVDWYKGG